MTLSLKKNMDLTEGNIVRQLVVFAFPLMLSSLFQNLYNTADTLIVGRFVGPTALAAVGSTGNVTGLIICFFIGMGTGAGVIISQAFGQRDGEALSKGVHTAIAMALLMGVILGILGIVLTRPILKMMGTPEDVMEEATLYLQINFMGLITTTLYNITSGILRAIGDSTRPFYYLVISGITNVVLNVIFVVGFHMGVAGVAIPTVISQALSAALALRALAKADGAYQFHWRELKMDWPTFGRIAKVGLPAGVQSMVINLSNVIIQSQINVFGSAAMAGHAAASKIDGYIYMPLGALSLANTTFVAQNLGAGRLKRARKGARTSLLLGALVTLVMGLSAAAAARPLVGMFSDEAEVIRFGIMSLTIRAVTYALYVPTDVLSGTIRAAGNGVVPMAVSLITMCLLRIVWLWIAIPIWHEYWVVLASYPVTWVLASGSYVVYYLSGRWLKNWKEKDSQDSEVIAESN